jgi:MinD-like ATPase involved in chromosome partitioning or flagellar assembly
MLVACWSVKGGAGVSVVAAALAHRLAVDHASALLVDLGGDQPDITGVPSHAAPGVADWLAGGDAVPADSLSRLEIALTDGLHLLPRGHGVMEFGERSMVLLAMLARDSRPVVVDCGVPLHRPGCPDAEFALAVASAATRSLLVMRPCLASLRRALAAPLRPSGVVVVQEGGRALDAGDVAEVLSVPVVAEVPVDPAVARTVDAGLLLARPPRPLQRGLRHAA